MSAKHATTSTPILPTLTERWSPRAFDTDHALPENALLSTFEAARWSPSASNTQPWRFIVARRGSESFEKIEATLAGFNSQWAGAASALVVNLAVVENDNGEPQRWAEYDLGQAVAHLSVQAHSEGLYVHQMGGFDAAKISESFALSDKLRPVSVMTIGKLGLPEQLAEPLKEREIAPRSRMVVHDLIVVND